MLASGLQAANLGCLLSGEGGSTEPEEGQSEDDAVDDLPEENEDHPDLSEDSVARQSMPNQRLISGGRWRASSLFQLFPYLWRLVDLINIFPFFDCCATEIMDSQSFHPRIFMHWLCLFNQDGVKHCIPPPKLRLTQPSFGGCEISFDSTFAKNSGSMLVYWRV